MTLLEASQIIFNITVSIAVVVVSILIIITTVAIIRCVRMVTSLAEEAKQNVAKLHHFFAEFSMNSIINAMSHFFKRKRSKEKQT